MRGNESFFSHFTQAHLHTDQERIIVPEQEFSNEAIALLQEVQVVLREELECFFNEVLLEVLEEAKIR